MARRKASTDSPQPAKRARVEVYGSEEAPPAGEAAPRQAPVPPTSPPAAEAAETIAVASPPRRQRRAAADKSAAAMAALALEDTAAASVPSQDTIHEKLFAPVSREELEAWQGWTEIESEPAFFNFILSELGVQDAKIHEVFGIDETSMAHLENPVGLIFLYRFVEEDENEVHEDCPGHLWFANQTTSSACGTIAMLNIAMNCDRLRLGDHLTRFKAATQHLHPALRGHLLSTDATIRSTHNSFARRLDMLISDNNLRYDWNEHNKKRKGNSRKPKAKKKTAKLGPGEEAAFHFIAYVPMGRDVWELNGMQEQPLKLGSISEGDGDWTAMARERIAARMEAYTQYDDTPVFSLLALCHTPRADEAAGGDGGAAAAAGNAADDDEDVRMAAARKRDYTPVVHRWVQKLADKGVLRQLATGKEEDEP